MKRTKEICTRLLAVAVAMARTGIVSRRLGRGRVPAVWLFWGNGWIPQVSALGIVGSLRSPLPSEWAREFVD